MMRVGARIRNDNLIDQVAHCHDVLSNAPLAGRDRFRCASVRALAQGAFKAFFGMKDSVAGPHMNAAKAGTLRRWPIDMIDPKEFERKPAQTSKNPAESGKTTAKLTLMARWSNQQKPG